MKHFFFSFLFVALATISTKHLQAQGKRSIGVRAGYQISGIYIDSHKRAETSNYSSFYLGVFKEKKIIPFLHWGIGLEYCQNGAVLSNDNNQVINYLGLPVHLKAKLGPIYALVGVQPKVKLSEKISIDGKKTDPTDGVN